MQKYHDEPKQYKGYLKSALMEMFVEKTAHAGRRLLGLRVGRYRTPFGIHGRSDHAYNGFLRAPLIRYSPYWGAVEQLLDTGVDVVAGTPRLYAEASVGVAQDQDRFARPGGLNGVVRLQSSIGPWIIGASHIRTRASDRVAVRAGPCRVYGRRRPLDEIWSATARRMDRWSTR